MWIVHEIGQKTHPRRKFLIRKVGLVVGQRINKRLQCCLTQILDPFSLWLCLIGGFLSNLGSEHPYEGYAFGGGQVGCRERQIGGGALLVGRGVYPIYEGDTSQRISAEGTQGILLT